MQTVEKLNQIYPSCQSCPHRLKQCLTGCGDKEMRSRVRKKYRTVYYIIKNNKGIKRLFYHDTNVLKAIKCDKITDVIKEERGGSEWRLGVAAKTNKLPSIKEFREECLERVRKTYKTVQVWKGDMWASPYTLAPSKSANRIVEVIDVSKCLNQKEKYMFRKDFMYNQMAHARKKRWLWAHRWWDKYYDQAKKIKSGFRPEDEPINGGYSRPPSDLDSFLDVLRSPF